MPTPQSAGGRLPVVTASLTTEVVRVTHGIREGLSLINKILTLDHSKWETTLLIGDVEHHTSRKTGPYPNQQMRISARPSTGYAALNYMNSSENDPDMQIVNSYNSRQPWPPIDLIFNGTTGAVFPRSAVIPIQDAREALAEWLETRNRPTCIEWQSIDSY